MFSRIERTVIEAPIGAFLRNLVHGSMTLVPKPPCFIANKKVDGLGKLQTPSRALQM